MLHASLKIDLGIEKIYVKIFQNAITILETVLTHSYAYKNLHIQKRHIKDELSFNDSLQIAILDAFDEVESIQVLLLGIINLSNFHFEKCRPYMNYS